METSRPLTRASQLACCAAMFLALSGTSGADPLDGGCGKNHYILDLPCIGAPDAAAAPPTFRITEIYSNLDGSVQFVELSEMAGLNGQNHFAGLTLTSTHNGVVKQFTFPSDLPTDNTANISIIVAATPETNGVPTIYQASCSEVECVGGNADTNVFHPDFDLPERFLPTDGGTIEFAGTDTVTFASLPTDGKAALSRDGAVANAFLYRVGCAGSASTCPRPIAGFYVLPALVAAIEYYNLESNHYFVSASAPDIDALDSGRFPGWQRTGQEFPVGARPLSLLGLEYHYSGGPVCRFYIPPSDGDSHFFSAAADECAQLQALHPDWVLETKAAFYVTAPDPTTGECPVMAGFVDGDIALKPVFRLWNQRADTNHRYTTSVDIRSAMIAQGWVSEGYGPMGVVMCVHK